MKSTIKFKAALLLGVVLIGTGILNAQTPILEKSYEVSKKARKGELSGIDFNEEKGTIELMYVLPDGLFSGNKIQSEVYTYNKDLELLNTEKIDIPLTKLRRGKAVKSDFSYTTVDAMPGFGIPMKVVFKKKEVARRFNWRTMSYQTTEKLLDKIVPKTGDDDRYSYTNKYSVPQDKSVLVISGKFKKKTPNMLMYYALLRCDIEGNVTVTDSINFTRPVTLIYSEPLTDLNEADEFELTRDWIMVFAPVKLKPYENTKISELTYVRVSPKGKVLERFSFDSSSNHWEIGSAFEKEGSVYLSGPAITKDPEKKYHSELYKAKGAQYTNIQICKITNAKLDFISSPALKDFAANQCKPSNQKKPVVFDGKSFVVNPLMFNDKGEIILTCQDGLEKKYNTNYMFKFDGNGTFKKFYNISITADDKKSGDGAEKWAERMENSFIISADGKTTYWLIRSTKTIQCSTSTTAATDPNGNGGMANLSATKTTVCYGKKGFDFCAINNETGELSELKTLGREKKDEFYLFDNAGYSVKMGNYIFVAGETLKGDKIMLSRIDISK